MVYPSDFEKKIGFDRIRELTSDLCLGNTGREKAENAQFSADIAMVSLLLEQTAEFQYILNFDDDFPADHFFDLSKTLVKMRVEGAYPELSELYDLRRSLATQKAISSYISNRNRDREIYPRLGKVTGEIVLYPFVSDSIDNILAKDGSMKDSASKELSEIRSEIRKVTASVSRKLHSVLKRSQAEGIVEQGAALSIRNGRGVIPLSVYDKNRISGLIHDQSATGKTVFIEPAEVVALNNQLVELEHTEKREIIRVLTRFADAIRPYIDDLLANFDIMGEIDYIRARALLGNRLGSVKPGLSESAEIDWRGARHPLLYLAFRKMDNREVVPLDIHLNSKERILLISGPNAGGKSVCLKSVGLIQYMLQCGYTVPVSGESRSGIFSSIFIDIGDDQSIDNDLSTYSSHLLNMKYFLRNSTRDTLVLIDEFGTGTEPLLGGAIAESILAELNNRGVYGVITTHYTNLKHFASSADGIVNGAMMFDNHLMQPLFRLDTGKPGSSFAFEIARKIGLPEEILKDASLKIGEDHINFDRHLKDILRDKRYWEDKRQEIRTRNKKLDELVEQYESEITNLKSDRREIISRAKEEAETLLKEANRQIENTIRQIKEAQADREKTKKVRVELDKLKVSIGETGEEDRKIERKIEKLRSRDSKVRKVKPVKPEKKDYIEEAIPFGKLPLKEGEFVIIEGTSSAAEVIRIEGKKVTVVAGNITTTVDISRIRRLSAGEMKRLPGVSRQVKPLNWEVTKRKSRFSAEKDIRGMRAEAALQVVQEMVDEAIVVQYPTIRILHGKGDGILRDVIRQYLATLPFVRSFRDEHLESGGSGITVVELDI